jgi:hypothetical protein
MTNFSPSTSRVRSLPSSATSSATSDAAPFQLPHALPIAPSPSKPETRASTAVTTPELTTLLSNEKRDPRTLWRSVMTVLPFRRARGSPYAAELDRKLAGNEPLTKVVAWWGDRYDE